MEYAGAAAAIVGLIGTGLSAYATYSAGQQQQAAALRLATGVMFGYVDAALNRAEQAYEAEREIWLRNTAAARTGAIDDILTQRERDQQSIATPV